MKHPKSYDSAPETRKRMLLLGKAVEQQEMLIKELIAGDEIDRDGLISRLTLVRGTMSMVQSQMKDVQLLFPSTK